MPDLRYTFDESSGEGDPDDYYTTDEGTFHHLVRRAQESGTYTTVHFHDPVTSGCEAGCESYYVPEALEALET